MKAFIFAALVCLMPMGALEAAKFSFGVGNKDWYFGVNQGHRYHNGYYYGYPNRYRGYYYGRPYYYNYRHPHYGYYRNPYQYRQSYPQTYNRYQCDKHGNCRKVYFYYSN